MMTESSAHLCNTEPFAGVEKVEQCREWMG